MKIIYPQGLIENYLNIAKAEKKDSKNIAELYDKNFSEHIMVQRGLLNDASYIESKLNQDEEEWIVAKVNNDVVGVAALAMIKPVGLAEIERVCVARSYRGNSLAYKMCSYLLDSAKVQGMGFIEAYARGDQPAMQKTFQKLGFKVYGVSPRFEVIHDGTVVREQFVHMGLELKPESIDMKKMKLIPKAQTLFDMINV
jgi:N-acetylglutamate synthase-like GNAT family acetyltransferase